MSKILSQLPPDDEGVNLVLGAQKDESKLGDVCMKYEILATVAANRLARTGLSVDDLKQEGMIGLMLAVKRYDPSKCDKFHPWAIRCIEGSIKNSIRRTQKHLGKEIGMDMPTLINKAPSIRHRPIDIDHDATLSSLIEGFKASDILTARELEFVQKKYGIKF